MTRSKKSDGCALCGGTHRLTREHVPPKNLFLPPRPRNTITVPLCEACNSSFHLDDEYFRICVTAGAAPGTPLGALWEKKVVGSSFTRSGGLKGRLLDDQELLRQYATNRPLEFEDGTPVPAELLPLLQPFDLKRVNAVVEKIVRCLHFNRTETRLNGIVEVETMNLPEAEKAAAIATPSGCVGHNNEFVYSIVDDAADCERWTLVFYEHRGFRVLVKSSGIQCANSEDAEQKRGAGDAQKDARGSR